MTETLKIENTAHFRHEIRTPVNHILGYSELLIEDAGERRLERFVPTLRQIHEGGRELLQSIQSALGEKPNSGPAPLPPEFQTRFRATAAELSQTVASLTADLEGSHRQTQADLAAISWALRQLAELSGMEVDARETKPGMPRPARRITDHPRSGSPVPAGPGRGRIMIADDDPGNRILLRRRLECEDHEVVEAGNGLEVLASLKESPCDLILLDLLMPVMDGFEVLARMKQDPGLRELPVIMISALDEMGSVVRCIEMGAEDYLPKPFDRVLLRARIGACLEKKWLRDRERRKTEELEKTLRLLEQAQEQLAAVASRDSLTGLANRRSVDALLETLVKQGKPFCAIFIDLNGFKKINDTLGHAAGDELMKKVADRLRFVFRSGDIVGRWGGDEFVAVLSGDDEFDLQSIVKRIGECFDDDFELSGGSASQIARVGAAVGVAVWETGDTATQVIQRADAAMYEEKLQKGDENRRNAAIGCLSGPFR